MSRRAGYWRYGLWVQAAERGQLAQRLASSLESLHALTSARQVRWHVDMDPLEF